MVASPPSLEVIESRTPSPSRRTHAAGKTGLPARRRRSPGKSLQLGNCGSPIETEAGWLVLTHGVGPMRTYNIGAILLDLEDPTRIIGRLREPLLSPAHDEQDGYVPNVVYSCGALLHADTLVIPYGIGDSAIGVATVPLDELLGSPDRRPRSDSRLTPTTTGEHRARQITTEAIRKEARQVAQGEERSQEGEARRARQEG